MTVSTATYNWYDMGTFVTASGTLAEVLTEMTAGASSHATLQSRENIISFMGDTSDVTAVWYTNKLPADWLVEDAR